MKARQAKKNLTKGVRALRLKPGAILVTDDPILARRLCEVKVLGMGFEVPIVLSNDLQCVRVRE